ncbi:alpha/beta fold hydrolase [Streptomyces spiramenti]|uniref:Alpha/beta hydrolase n=1 Tax=Streptomyces spiramenti TaxID=2720606 RepID=A0ABX1AVC6_9ACTN|nr:alpha/beta fold hydrolase [Streptomyces spiramenti]NJP68357.1 alpha/beta hydrolase [Streptomyces spiramenti]
MSDHHVGDVRGAGRRPDDRQARTRQRLAASADVARVRRPVGDGADEEFDLHYVRTGPRGSTPVLFVPGGPGLASVVMYRALRARAARQRFDVVMVEHRGIGLSRVRDDGRPLPRSAVTVTAAVEDLAAVLDHAGIDRAVVYGASYGSYLAQGFGVRHPDRVASMVLDSPVLTAHDDAETRRVMRERLWEGSCPDTEGVAGALRGLVARGLVDPAETGAVVQVAYEMGGVPLLEALYRAVASGRGHRTWRWLASLGDAEARTSRPFVMEFDLAGVIAFRELKYRPDPDGLPLDPNLGFLELSREFPEFTGEPFDLPAELPAFRWPVAVVSGDRELRTPRTVAERIVDSVPDGTLVPLANHGHSALDSHPAAALRVARLVRDGQQHHLPGEAAALGAVRRSGGMNLVAPLIRTRLTSERLLPRRSPAPTPGEAGPRG